MARTAVIASTATVTSKAVSGAMGGAAQAGQEQQMANSAAVQSQAELEQLKAQMNAMQAQATMSATPATPAGADLMTQLQQLTQMKEMGALTEAEFQQAKAKLLGS
jgi:hypothetical protein